MGPVPVSSASSDPLASTQARFQVLYLHRRGLAIVDAVAATLTSPAVTGPVADLAGADPITLPQPSVLHVVSEPPMPELLPAHLSPIRDGGVSHGTHMLADPALDLSDPADRGEQANRWLIQMAADAGLLGMEQLVSKMRGSADCLPSALMNRPPGLSRYGADLPTAAL